MEEQEEKKPREEFVVKIGPDLRTVLNEQKKKVRDATYNCVNPSDYSAGEIIAKKIVDNNLI